MMTRLPAEYDDIEPMMTQMSPERRHEMIALAEQMNMSPADMFGAALDKSTESFTYFEDSKPIAIGGVVRTPVGGGCWMIACEGRVEKHKKFFLQQSETQIRLWADAYGDLFADVAAVEAKSIRWLEWLGFRQTGKMNCLGRDFCRLERRS